MSAIALQWQFQLLLFLLFFLLPHQILPHQILPHQFLSGTFFGDALIKLDETLQEYYMPCAVVLLRVYLFQNGCPCHGNGRNAKRLKNTKMSRAGYSPKTDIYETLQEQHPHLVEQDKLKKSESVGQTLPQLP